MNACFFASTRSGPQLEPDKLVMQMALAIRKEVDNEIIPKLTTHHSGYRNIRQGTNIWIKGSMEFIQPLLLIYHKLSCHKASIIKYITNTYK